MQAFAKKALPTCGSGQILSASGSEFNCVNSGFLSAETDPTVQGFAKSPLPNCNTGQVLSSSGSNLTCIADERGLTQETDPYVHTFARTETAISNCEAGKVLTMTGSRLSCVFDAVGITVETDPKVQPFAKNDIPGYTLNACAAGEVLTAVSQAGVTILKCETGTNVVGPIISATKLDDLNDVDATNPTADDVLRFVGGKWVNSSDKIGTTTNAKWCHFTASEIVCDRDIPAPQPASACAAGQVVTWDHTNKVWSCSAISGMISETLALDNLSDVSISAPVAGEGLTYTGTGWVNGYNARIARYDTDVRTVDTNGGLGAIQMVVDGTGVLTASGTYVGIGTTNPNAPLDVIGTISGTNMRFSNWLSGPIIQASQYVSAGSIHTSGTVMVSNSLYADNIRSNGNLYVGGALYVSGSQTIGGVIFADGGVSATGIISATRFVGDGSGLTGVAGGDIIISGTTFVQTTRDESVSVVTAGSPRMIVGSNGRVGIGTVTPRTELEVIGTVSATNLHLSGNLTVSGTQSIDGVVFANGGVSATGTISATKFVGDGSGLSGVAADWYGLLRIPTQVVAVSDGTAIQMVGVSATNVSVTSNLTAANGIFTNVLANNGSFGNVNATGYVSAASIYTSGTVRVSNTLRADDLASVATTRVGSDLYVGGNLYVSGSQVLGGVMFANGGVSATGTVTATSFSGDGSGLTGLAAGDRIVSGTTLVLANQDRSITVRTANTDRMIIGENGNVGIGVDTPSHTFHVQGLAGFTNTSLAAGSSVRFPNTGSVPGIMLLQGDGLGGILKRWDVRNDGAGLNFFESSNGTSLGDTRVVITNGGNMGVGGLMSPTATLQVSGSFVVSTTQQNTTPTLYVGTNGKVGIGTAQPSTTLHVFGSTADMAVRFTGANGGLVTAGSSGPALLTVTDGGGGRPIFQATGNYSGKTILIESKVDQGVNEAYFRVGKNSTTDSNTLYMNVLVNKIGMGTANPSQTLHISGTLLTTSWTYINAAANVRVTPSAPLEVSGTISATAFVGDGSGLTGVTAGSSDRIVSGSTNQTSMVAISNTGYISVTQGGVNTAWFHPQRGLVTVGISTTGVVSASGIFIPESRYLNFGSPNAAPEARMYQQSGWMRIAAGGERVAPYN